MPFPSFSFRPRACLKPSALEHKIPVAFHNRPRILSKQPITVKYRILHCKSIKRNVTENLASITDDDGREGSFEAETNLIH